MDAFKDDLVEFGHPNEEDYQNFTQFLKQNHLENRHFVITLPEKKGHPWEPRITDTNALAVNDQLGRAIHLVRGQRYFFTFRPNNNHTLLFTLDPIGGPEAAPLAGFPAPLENFKSFSLLVGDSIPETFYYQCGKHSFLGGPVIIHTHMKRSNINQKKELIKNEKPDPNPNPNINPRPIPKQTTVTPKPKPKSNPPPIPKQTPEPNSGSGSNPDLNTPKAQSKPQDITKDKKFLELVASAATKNRSKSKLTNTNKNKNRRSSVSPKGKKNTRPSRNHKSSGDQDDKNKKKVVEYSTSSEGSSHKRRAIHREEEKKSSSDGRRRRERKTVHRVHNSRWE